MYPMLAYKSVLLITLFQHGNSLQMYLQSSPTRTWDQAYSDCQGRGMQLAVLNSQDDFDDAVSYVVANNAAISSIWIGYKNPDPTNGGFGWINGDTTQFDTWGAGDPDISWGEACVVLKKSVGYKFADRGCTTPYSFLCTGPEEVTTTADCTCGCNNVPLITNYQNYTFDELKVILSPVTDRLRQELLVDKTTLSSYTNKRKSQKDDRPSAQQLGYVGMTFLILIAVLTIFLDLTSWFQT